MRFNFLQVLHGSHPHPKDKIFEYRLGKRDQEDLLVMHRPLKYCGMADNRSKSGGRGPRVRKFCRRRTQSST